MPTPVLLAVDFNQIRKALVECLQAVMQQTCIEEEPETQAAPRPPKPYFSYNITTPAAKVGDDSEKYIGTHGPAGPTQQFMFERAGQRKMTVSFHCYAQNKDDAWSNMSTWQSSLELSDVKATLRKAGIAVLLNGSVADNSQLLNTGYEGRAQMDVQFNIVQRLQSNLGTIESVDVTPTIKNEGDETCDNKPFTIPAD